MHVACHTIFKKEGYSRRANLLSLSGANRGDRDEHLDRTGEQQQTGGTKDCHHPQNPLPEVTASLGLKVGPALTQISAHQSTDYATKSTTQYSTEEIAQARQIPLLDTDFVLATKTNSSS